MESPEKYHSKPEPVLEQGMTYRFASLVLEHDGPESENFKPAIGKYFDGCDEEGERESRDTPSKDKTLFAYALSEKKKRELQIKLYKKHGEKFMNKSDIILDIEDNIEFASQDPETMKDFIQNMYNLIDELD